MFGAPWWQWLVVLASAVGGGLVAALMLPEDLALIGGIVAGALVFFVGMVVVNLIQPDHGP